MFRSYREGTANPVSDLKRHAKCVMHRCHPWRNVLSREGNKRILTSTRRAEEHLKKERHFPEERGKSRVRAALRARSRTDELKGTQEPRNTHP